MQTYAINMHAHHSWSVKKSVKKLLCVWFDSKFSFSKHACMHVDTVCKRSFIHLWHFRKTVFDKQYMHVHCSCGEWFSWQQSFKDWSTYREIAIACNVYPEEIDIAADIYQSNSWTRAPLVACMLNIVVCLKLHVTICTINKKLVFCGYLAPFSSALTKKLVQYYMHS